MVMCRHVLVPGVCHVINFDFKSNESRTVKCGAAHNNKHATE